MINKMHYVLVNNFSMNNNKSYSSELFILMNIDKFKNKSDLS